MSRDWLQDLFATAGQVTGATVMHDRHTHQSLGFGFVHMPDTDQAREAITRFNGQTVAGRLLFAVEAGMRQCRAGGATEIDTDHFYSDPSGLQTSARRFLHVGRY